MQTAATVVMRTRLWFSSRSSRAASAARAASTALLLASLGCGGPSLTGPKATPNDASTYVEIPYPPPAARIEFIPAKPNDKGASGTSVEWVDGEWRWRGKRWRWTEGGWFDVPSGASLAHWAVVVRSDGQMLFAPSAWHDDSGKVIPAPTRLEKGVSNVAALDTPETVRDEPAVHGPDVPANPNAVAGAHAAQDTASAQPKSTGSP